MPRLAPRKVRRPYLPPGPALGWVFGYLHPSGACPHEPACTPNRTRCLPQPKQWLAHTSAADVLLYGGAVGGGKSEYAIVEAITYCLTYPGVQVAIFRRTHPELEASILTRFFALVPPEIAFYSKGNNSATFFNGSKIWFRSCQYEKDVYRYQSAQWAALFIDEAGHFTEFIVRYLYTRVRWPGVPNILRLTANPGGPGMGFLRRWFMKPLPAELGNRPLPKPGDVWRPLPSKNDPTPPDRVPSRQFIPAYFSDNKALVEYRPDYLSQVYSMPGDLGAQLAEGNWDANDSMIVGPHWEEQHAVKATDLELLSFGYQVGQVIPWHVIPNAAWKPPKGAAIYGSVDYGYGAPWAFHLHATLPDGHIRTFFEFYETRVRDVDQAKRIRALLDRHGWRPEWILLEPIMWNSRAEMGLAKSIAEVYGDHLGDITQLRHGAAGRNARVSRPQRWIDAMQTAPDGLPWWTCTAACPHLIRTVPDVPWDMQDPEVEDEKSENHAYESCLVAGTLVATATGPVPIERVTINDRVLTRNGYKRVTRAWQSSASALTMVARCSDGRQLQGTPDHLVWTENRGFTRLEELSNGDILWTTEAATCRPTNPPVFSRQMCRFGAAIVTTVAAALRVMVGAISSALAGCFIGESGWTATAPFRRVCTSTMSTRTGQTTPPRTSSPWPRRGISRFTADARHSDNAKLDERTSGSLKPRDWSSRVLPNSSVRAAAWLRQFSRGSSEPSGIAPTSARCERPRSAGILDDIHYACSRAWAAARRRRPIGMGSVSVATLRVTTVRPSGAAPVYDLTVDSQPEFFANGILVHNCGRFFEARPFASRPPVQDPIAHLDDISRAHHAAHAAREKKPTGGTLGGLARR